MINELWHGRRYYSLGSYIRNTFGEKLYKIPLSAVSTCPNRDGRAGYGGCIFCSGKGSGDYAGDINLPVKNQIEQGKSLVGDGFSGGRYIAYFQSFTSTYAPTDYLRSLFSEAINHPEVALLSIATRPDCLEPDKLDLLSELNRIKPLWVELGLQTSKEETISLINRCYENDVYERAVEDLNSRGIDTITHLILGLPGETEEDMISSLRFAADCGTKGVKLQLLHVLKDTPLQKMYDEGDLYVLSEEEYVRIVCHCLEQLPPDMVIHRLTGDGPKDILVAPEWSTHKRNVLNHIHHYLKEHNTWQGKLHR
ncbi:MAG: TIGR01212 family radical SAM protein [Lachnospiraceae bacterium]|nr:TIGR01212 family radical SAM protein [Lachnospiraceae bacterium]